MRGFRPGALSCGTLRGKYFEHPMVTGAREDYYTRMNSSLKRIALLLLAATILALASTSCQTKKGFGQDVEKLGDKIKG